MYNLVILMLRLIMRKRYLVLLVALALAIPVVARAKGEFDYIAIKGPGIVGEIDVTSPALTQDFFVFADFAQGAISPPSDPGQGYQVTRVYVEFTDSKPKDLPFDELHYYPYTGYVFYDGLVDGESEYDGKWYSANPSAEGPVRSALKQRALLTWIPFAVVAAALIWFAVAYNRKPKE